jgi:hypothetical protein
VAGAIEMPVAAVWFRSMMKAIKLKERLNRLMCSEISTLGWLFGRNGKVTEDSLLNVRKLRLPYFLV